LSRLDDLRDRLYSISVVPLVPRLPASAVYRLAVSYADLRSAFDRAGFEEVTLCMRQVLGASPGRGGWSKEVRSYFRNRVCLKVDALRLAGDGQPLTQLVDVRGKGHLDRALADGRGAVLCSGHFGSLRACAGLVGALGYPVTLISNWTFSPGPTQKDSQRKALTWKPIRNHLQRENLLTMTRHGPNLAVALQAASVLRRGEFILTTVDTPGAADNRKGTTTVSFLGGSPQVLPGPVEMAKFAGAPMLAVFLYRVKDWNHLILEILPIAPGGLAAIQECMTKLEALIRAHPGQWELWDMRKLVSLGLYPRESAMEFYERTYGEWTEWA
jgi:lauroyl/myristoyl acyltransferase